MLDIFMKEILDLLEGGRKSIPKQGDVFVMYMRGVGYIPGLVVKDNFPYSTEKLCIIYLYNEISNDKCHAFLLDKENLLLPPALVTPRDWRGRGGFETIKNLPKSEMDIFQNHCFYDDLKNRYIDQSKSVCNRFEPCGDYSVSNIGSKAIDIYEKLNPGVEIIYPDN